MIQQDFHQLYYYLAMKIIHPQENERNIGRDPDTANIADISPINQNILTSPVSSTHSGGKSRGHKRTSSDGEKEAPETKLEPTPTLRAGISDLIRTNRCDDASSSTNNRMITKDLPDPISNRNVYFFGFHFHFHFHFNFHFLIVIHRCETFYHYHCHYHYHYHCHNHYHYHCHTPNPNEQWLLQY